MSATLTALKALADSSRLDVVGLLAQRPRSGDELATILNLTPSTISHHVARLQAAGLVSASAQQYYRIYTLNTDALRSLAKELAPEAMAGRMGLEASVDSNAYAAEILARWLKDNRLQGIPRKSHHKQIVLEWLTRKFAPDQRYDTDQVNETMEQWCRPEYCTELIRLLISDQYLGRLPDGSWYWRVDSPAVRQPGFDPSSLPIAQSPDPLRFHGHAGRLAQARSGGCLRRAGRAGRCAEREPGTEADRLPPQAQQALHGRRDRRTHPPIPA